MLLLATLAACASGPTWQEKAATVAPPDPAQGRIVLYRTAALGAAVQPAVFLNGQAVGSAVPLGIFWVDRPPGDYRVSTTTEVERTLSFTLAAGQRRYVQLAISLGFFVGHVYPELVEDKEALAEIGPLHVIGGG